MNTGNEETIVTKAEGNHCDCEAEQMVNTGNEETVATKPKEITATAKQSR